MKGWLLVGATGLKDETALAKWVRRGLDYAASLTKKQSRQSVAQWAAAAAHEPAAKLGMGRAFNRTLAGGPSVRTGGVG